MASRLLISLEGRIARARDAQEQACLKAERAALLARQGSLDEARAELATIHARYDSRPNGLVSAWVSFAEGLVVYFSHLGGTSRDKLKRSLALSEAIGARPIQALSAAWLAQIEFASLNFDPMLQYLSIAFRCAETNQHSARSRACLVAADAYHWSERLELALPWYSRAHQHASEEGDESTISALMHNMAWMRTAEARRRSVSGDLDVIEARQAQLSADSTYRYDEMVGMQALGTLVAILRSQICILREEYADALVLLDSNFEESVKEGLERMACVMLADAAWCRYKLGDLAGSKRDAVASLSRISVATDVDDRAMTHSRLAKLYAASGDHEIANDHAKQAEALWRVHVQRQVRIVPALDAALKTIGAPLGQLPDPTLP